MILPLLLLVAAAQEEIALRPAVPAGGPAETIVQRGKDGVNDRAVMEVSNPSITAYLPEKGKATGAGILICPGGGYARLAIDKEGHDVARWLTSIGVAGFVLKYRLPGGPNMKPSLGNLQEAATAARVAISDAEDAMRLIRGNSKWNLKSVGMMGFSAGGHLAAMLGMTGSGATRPDFLALIYPAVPRELKIDGSTPRTFLVHADDDGLSAGDHSARFYLALKQAKVPAELHVYTNGGHGFGIQKTTKTSAKWPSAFAEWLLTIPQT